MNGCVQVKQTVSSVQKIKETQAKHIKEIGVEEALREARWKDLQDHLRAHVIQTIRQKGPPSMEDLDSAWMDWELDGLTLIATEQELGKDTLKRQTELKTWAGRGRMAQVRRVVGYAYPQIHRNQKPNNKNKD